jgi:biopolymer transport protein ExbD
MFASLAGALALLFTPAPADAEPSPSVMIDMPDATSPSSERRVCKTVLVRIDRAGGTTLNDQPIEREQLGRAVVALNSAAGSCGRPAIMADRNTPYDVVLRVVSLLHHNGIRRISLIAPPDE